MNPIHSWTLVEMLSALWKHVGRRRRIQLIAIGALMLLSIIAELASIGAILPFLGALSAPENLFSNAWAGPLVHGLGLVDPNQLLLPLTVLFGLAILFSAAARIALLWAQTRFSFAIGADLGMDVYRRTLYQPYAVHVARNSSEVISGIMNKVGSLVFIAILPVLNMASSALILISVMCLLVMIEPVISIITFLGFGAIYALISGLTKQQLLRDGQLVTQEQNQLLKLLQEGLGGIRDILIGGPEIYLRYFRNADLSLRRSSANIAIIGGVPRYAIEALATILIASMAYAMAGRSGGLTATIPVLGALALGAQRILPLLQQIYHSFTAMRGGKAVLADALVLLAQPMPVIPAMAEDEPIPFQQEIVFRDLRFRYNHQASWILNGIDLKIPRGCRLGVIGVTGSGKSTLIDILMGLISPTQGTLSVDGRVVGEANRRAWQMHIAHVPQNIFLADTSIAENIAFGLAKDEVNPQRVRLAAEQAQIAATIENWRDGYGTVVGERGIRPPAVSANG
ncbi:MAG: ABC transporter ATP-binding protein [Sulfuritalea sp.]|nr:ABC transporter ATP-binding protein [Sulfuritalea sp.]